MTSLNAKSMRKMSTASTVIDAVLAFVRGQRKAGVLLLGAAALSSRVPGLGTAASVLLRVVRRLR